MEKCRPYKRALICDSNASGAIIIVGTSTGIGSFGKAASSIIGLGGRSSKASSTNPRTSPAHKPQ